jgi:hypothetical protein
MDGSTVFVLVTLAFTVASQPVIVRWAGRGRTKRFWLAMEAAWIAMAIFGVWFAASELGRFRTRASIDSRYADAKSEWMRVQDGAEFTRDMLNYNSASSPAARWFTYLGGVLDLGPQNFKWRWFLGQNEDLWRPRQSANESRVPQWPAVDFRRLTPGEPYSEEAQQILVRLHGLEARYDDIGRDEKAAASSISNTQRIVFVVVFPVVFALRIGKVVVEWRAKDAGSLPLAKGSNAQADDPPVAHTEKEGLPTASEG